MKIDYIALGLEVNTPKRILFIYYLQIPNNLIEKISMQLALFCSHFKELTTKIKFQVEERILRKKFKKKCLMPATQKSLLNKITYDKYLNLFVT